MDYRYWHGAFLMPSFDYWRLCSQNSTCWWPDVFNQFWHPYGIGPGSHHYHDDSCSLFLLRGGKVTLLFPVQLLIIPAYFEFRNRLAFVRPFIQASVWFRGCKWSRRAALTIRRRLPTHTPTSQQSRKQPVPSRASPLIGRHLRAARGLCDLTHPQPSSGPWLERYGPLQKGRLRRDSDGRQNAER